MSFKYNGSQAGLGSVERRILDALSRLGKVVVRASDLESELGYDRVASNLALSRLTKKGWLQRLKSGVYCIVPLGSESSTPVPEDAWAIAMELFSPCYISGWTASEHWELTEQLFNDTVVFTAKKQRNNRSVIAGLNYRTKSISAKNIFGISKIWSSNTPIFIADIHKTMIDVLDDPELGGGARHVLDMVNAYINHKDANIEILLEYAEKLGHGSVFKRLGYVGEKIMKLPASYLDRIHRQINSGIINFDPHGPNSGVIIKKWGLRINTPIGVNE